MGAPTLAKNLCWGGLTTEGSSKYSYVYWNFMANLKDTKAHVFNNSNLF